MLYVLSCYKSNCYPESQSEYIYPHTNQSAVWLSELNEVLLIALVVVVVVAVVGVKTSR